MSEDENSQESVPEKVQEELVKEVTKPDTSAAITKLLLLVGVVFALTKWGLPLMDGMVDEFKEAKGEKTADDSDVVAAEGVMRAGDTVAEVEEVMVPQVVEVKPEVIEDGDGPLKSAMERGINKWLKKQVSESSASVQFINRNGNGSRLAVEYEERGVDGETESKELIFMKDEFGIYIYLDAAGVRQIRVRDPK